MAHIHKEKAVGARSAACKFAQEPHQELGALVWLAQAAQERHCSPSSGRAHRRGAARHVPQRDRQKALVYLVATQNLH